MAEQPKKMISCAMINNILINDHIYRSLRRWPLFNLADIRAVASEQYEYEYLTAVPYTNDQKIVNNPTQELRTAYPEVDYLIENFPLIAAGGAVYKCLYGLPQTSDIDMFFVGDISTRDAEDMVVQIMKHFEETYPGVHFERNQNVTTVITPSEGRNTRKYQFVHRIYSHRDEVIGAFDLHASALFYNGQDIHATPAGVFCSGAKINIMDHTRKSLSYEYRLQKYRNTNHVTILFPTIPVAKMIEKLTHNNRYITIEVIKKFSLVISQQYDYNTRKDIDGRCVAGMSRREPTPAQPDDNDKYDYAADVSKPSVRNSQIAMHGRIDCISWCGKNVKEILEPKITFHYPPTIIRDLDNPTSISEAIPVFKFMEQNTLHRGNLLLRAAEWFGNDLGNILIHVKTILLKKYNNELDAKLDMSQIDKNLEVKLKYTNAEYKSDLAKLVVMCKEAISKTIYPKIHEAQIAANAGVTWRLLNTGKLLSASFRPIVVKPLEYYTPKNYTTPNIYIPEPVETLLRLLVKNGVGVWKYIQKDVLQIIFHHYLRGLN